MSNSNRTCTALDPRRQPCNQPAESNGLCLHHNLALAAITRNANDKIADLHRGWIQAAAEKAEPGYTFALMQRRIARFVLFPAAITFAALAWSAITKHIWWAAGVFALLPAYLSWLDGGSFIRRLPGTGPPSRLSDEEIHALVQTLVRLGYTAAVAAAVVAISSGLKFYWALPIGLGLGWIVNVLVPLVVFLTVPKPREK
jgi:hypothetical protein